MACEQEMTENAVEVLGGVFQLGSNFSDVSYIITSSGTLASAVPLVEEILTIAKYLIQDSNNKTISSHFHELSNKIDLWRGELEEPKNKIQWESTELKI